MKVKIGPFVNWLGPYQIADRVFFWLDARYQDDQGLARPIYKLHDWLGDLLGGKRNQESMLQKFCQWIHNHEHRTIKVKLDHYDHWNAGHTIALIALPLLKELKKNKQGSPQVDLCDVPEALWPKQLAGPSNGYCDDTVHERWSWVLDEIIWALEQTVDDEGESQFYDHSAANNKDDDLMTQIGKIKIDKEGLEAWQDRKANGLRLFGKYYQGLWD